MRMKNKVTGNLTQENKEIDGSCLIKQIGAIHTTPMGVERIKRNLELENEDVVAWCKERVQNQSAVIIRKGKNWYVEVEGCIITINAHSYTIITAHKVKRK